MSKIILYPDNLLTQESLQVESFDENLTKLFQEMEQAMARENGMGISAVQIGVLSRAMIVKDEDGSLLKIVNPQLIDDPLASNTFLKEGCLSIPGVHIPVRRKEDAQVSYKDDKGEERNVFLSGWAARCFYHELDHLNGKTLFDHVANFQKGDMLKKYNRAKKKLGI